MKRLRNYFKTVTSGLRADGTIGGTRFLKGDKPTEDVFKDLRESHPMFLESADRAKVSTGGGLGEEVGLVTLATDVQAKANATQLSDRSLVAQPHQLPTSESGTNDFTVTTVAADGANSATQNPFELVADATTTRNKYILKFQTAFVKWILRRVLPSGGTTGQAVVKISNTDFDYTWGTIGGGAVTSAAARILTSFITPVTLPAVAITDFFSYTLPLNTLKADGDVLELFYSLTTLNTFTNTAFNCTIQFNGINIYIKNFVSSVTTSPVAIKITIMRISNTQIKVTASSESLYSSPDAKFTTISSLNLTTTAYIIKGNVDSTGGASGTANGVADFGYIQYKSIA